MTVASLTLELMIYGAGSLKAKRQVIRSLKERIRNTFNVSVAEVDGQDLWQRATLGVAVVAADVARADEVIDKVRSFVADDMRVSIIDAFREIR